MNLEISEQIPLEDRKGRGNCDLSAEQKARS
jgi:hypothetical protein